MSSARENTQNRERERERRGREVEALDLLLEFAEILGVVLDIE